MQKRGKFMRMRKKKNLEERLSLCDNLFYMETSERDYRMTNEEKTYIDTKELFGNDNPVYLEIGCGKGGFAKQLAEENPDVNVLAVEKTANVLITACEQGKDIKNLHFMLGGAEYLKKFIKDGSIDRIYLNFSCPFPKKAYAAHRLTNPRFLEIYRDILKEGAEIHQKTDNMHFFEYSVESFSSCGFALKNVSLDLHNSGFEGNIMTEYEAQFTALGKPIYRLEAYIK